MEDDHGLNLSLTLKCPPVIHPHHHNHNHTVNPLPPPSKLLSSLGPCPYKLIPSPYNSLPHNHQILPLPNYKPPSYADMDKEIAAYIEEQQRQAAAMVVKEREQPEVEEELVVSSPNSAVSTTRLSGNKRSVEREEHYEVDRDLSPNYIVVSEDEDGGDAGARKKLRLSKEQAAVLEETFKKQHTLSTKQKVALAKQLDLRPRQVEVWFQNRRARTKLKQTEVNCRYLKRYCQTLSEENKRLQKELTELRALKLSPVNMNMTPPTTLSMCPKCVRVTKCSSSSSSTQASSARVGAGVGASVPNTNHLKSTSVIPFAKLISSEALDIRRPRPRP